MLRKARTLHAPVNEAELQLVKPPRRKQTVDRRGSIDAVAADILPTFLDDEAATLACRICSGLACIADL